MNGNCYSSDGINPTLTCNKNEGNRVAIPVLTPERGTKRQNGRRFKEDGEEAFTLTGQDRHGVAIEVEPIQMKKHQIHDNKGYASALSANDRRMKIGNYQERTMVGYNATLKEGGGYDTDSTCSECEELQRPVREQSDDDSGSDVFAIDKGIRPEERDIANCIESREDRGLSRRKQEGTLICIKV